MQGILVVWSEPKAYGFVQPDGSSEKLFIHITNFPEGTPKSAIRLGSRIEFEIGDPISLGKKPQAVRAKIVSTPTAGLAVLGQTPQDSEVL
jgi:cold shock CspA family protein